ncbi:fasciclin-like arabinogalactan protein 20 [Pyrus ussuriensis x Pyrus communis]|uniref:Fasciclin-like arabinogalactan protein 20 n=1 Tax=Pyrus ussuriensis x Pyrus communis TaxID=2448454 RepID=A0A5N5G0V3_9ROSA|nr:fasciclin-like arabinogalactan protein 20 [Pyrus ussuriensis x Pyrus communis]
MDPKFALRFLLVLLLVSPLFVTNTMQAEAVQPYEETNQRKPSGTINGGMVSAVLSDKGYHAMSLTLDRILEAINPNSTITLFCPQDKAFFNSKYPQPPLTLLKYHAVPFKMNKDSMEASFRHGSKVDTLLPGHPLVVTSLPAGTHGYASLNLVKVTEWDLYNNGRLIVHGVEDFFDPAFQTLRYPQFDVVAKDVSSGGSWLKKATESWFLLF